MHLSIIQLQVISLPCSVYPGTCIRMIIPDRAQVVRSLNYDVLLSCEVHVHVAARDLTVSLVLWAELKVPKWKLILLAK